MNPLSFLFTVMLILLFIFFTVIKQNSIKKLFSLSAFFPGHYYNSLHFMIIEHNLLHGGI